MEILLILRLVLSEAIIPRRIACLHQIEHWMFSFFQWIFRGRERPKCASEQTAEVGPKFQSLLAIHSISPPLGPNLFPTTMFKPTQTYDRVAAAESQAELDDWHEEPIESVESRSRQVNLHRRPGFFKKGLLGSVAVNAVLLMVCGWLYLKLRVSVSPHRPRLRMGGRTSYCPWYKA